MEVYATIFMIFVSHVLSSFSSRQRDGRQIPLPKIRRVPIVHFQNHNNDEENQQEIASEYLLPLTTGLHREKITNDKSDQNTQYNGNEIPDVKSTMGSNDFVKYNTFDTNFDKMISRLYRKMKDSVTTNQDVFSSVLTNELSSLTAPINNKADLEDLDKMKTEISSTNDSASEAWANRAKVKYITVRPWNQFCLNRGGSDDCIQNVTNTECPPVTYFPVECPTDAHTSTFPITTSAEDLCIPATTCYPPPTKRKKNRKPCYPTTQIASEQDRPWLFYADPTKGRPLPRIPNRPNPTDKYPTETTICRNKFRSSFVNPGRNNYIENFLIKRPRKKRKDYFLGANSQLGILKSSLKGYINATKKSRSISDIFPVITSGLLRDISSSGRKKMVPLAINHYNNNLLSRINKLNKRSLKKKCNVIGFFPFGKHKKDHNLTGGLPKCQKACYFNLTDLVNARTIKPPGYFKKQPSLLMCCEYEDITPATLITFTSASSTASSSNELDDLEGTTIGSSLGSPSDDLGGNTSVTDLPSTEKLGTTESSSVSTLDSNTSTATVFRILLQLRNIPNTKRSHHSQKSKEKFYLKVLIGKKEDLTKSNSFKIESKVDSDEENPLKSYVWKTRSPKKVHPWDSRKFCPCSVGKKNPSCCTGDPRGDKLPWVSTCCMSSSKATGKSSKTTSKSGTTTKGNNMTSGKGTETTTSDGEAADSVSGTTSTGSVSGTTSSGSVATGSGTTGSDSEATSRVSEATSSGSKATTKGGKATKKRHKTTTRKAKSSKKGSKVKRSTAHLSACLSNDKFDVENTLFRASISTPLSPTGEDVGLFNNLNQPPIEDYKSLNKLSPPFDNENILVVLRVPVAMAQKYNENGNLHLVLPLNDTSFPKYIKPRSIFEQFIPSLFRKTTLRPMNDVLATSKDKLSILPTSANIRKDHNYLSSILTDKSPLLNAIVRKHITKASPSCLKKKKELVFETSYGDKKANCIIDDNNLFYQQEIENDYSNINDASTEECDGKYVSYLLKFPKETAIKSSSLAPMESHSTGRGLKVLHSHDSPPKYFIEVPELLGEMINMSGDVRVTSLASPTMKETSSNLVRPQKPLKHGSPLKKPLFLRLQPFDINGHKVYLPINSIDSAFKSKAKAPIFTRNTDAGEYTDETIISSIRPPSMRGFIGKNDSVLPFALIPAYLAMHPKEPLNILTSEPHRTKYIMNTIINDEQKADFDIVPQEGNKKKYEEIPLTILLNNMPMDKKSPQLSKLLKSFTLNSSPSSKITSKAFLNTKKSSRKSSSRRSSSGSTPNKPTFIILMKDIANIPFLEDFELPQNEVHTSTLGQKDSFLFEPFVEYVN